MNTINLEGVSYKLVKVDEPEFIIQGYELPAPFKAQKMAGGYNKYKSLTIGENKYGVQRLLPGPLNENAVINKGWQYQEQRGIEHIFHKDFDGRNWFELVITFSNGDVDVKRMINLGNKERLLFSGSLSNADDLNIIMNLLNIE